MGKIINQAGEWMNCIICDSKSNYYFSKEYTSELFAEMMKDIGPISYYKCVNCGFTASKTHFELKEREWDELNHAYHHLGETVKDRDLSSWHSNPPPYAQQALMLKILAVNRLIDVNSVLDYAGGYGRLSFISEKYHDIFIFVYDPYVRSSEYGVNYVKNIHLNYYDTVINSAMLEHITSRGDLDKLNERVKDNGCLIIHSVICENIPKDPDWFYLKPPVHCAFHTNKSMALLMKQWGNKNSLYCPSSKSWVLYKNVNKDIASKV